MSIGYPITKVDLDNRMGAAVVTLRDAFVAILALKAELDDVTILPDATLTTLGYLAGEITSIRASFTDLGKLDGISRGTQTQAVVNDFWFNAKHLAGLNFH